MWVRRGLFVLDVVASFFVDVGFVGNARCHLVGGFVGVANGIGA